MFNSIEQTVLVICQTLSSSVLAINKPTTVLLISDRCVPLMFHALCSILPEEGSRLTSFIQALASLTYWSWTVGQIMLIPWSLDVVRRRMQMVGWIDASPMIVGDARGKALLDTMAWLINSEKR
ncbi:hypothetical protein RND81_03G219300 [Saponaria officinalis]|uniref:Uncharacterized protein n=1 Tax=Saponaria officinalis TaxID=3572 RepID=A0AAW1MAD6_SAPOF